MKFVDEDAEFGFMSWRLLSREPAKKLSVYALPVSGVGTYMRTVIGDVWEEPILLKNALVIEVIMREPGPALVDAQNQEATEPRFKCLSREILSVDLAKARFMPKGRPHPGLDLFPGALLTQEQRPMVMPANMPPEMMKKLAEAANQEVQS